MTKLEDLLQDRLERLERGEPLAACLAGLPEQEADLLELAAMLGKLQYPVRDSEIVAAQRAELLKLGAKEVKMQTQTPRKVRQIPKLSLPSWPRPLLLFSALAALVFICALVTMMGAGIAWWSSQRAKLDLTPQTGIAHSPLSASELATAHSLYIPVLTFSQPLTPQRAGLEDTRGLVQLQTSAGDWIVAGAGRKVTAGQRVRTGRLSSASLVFYDGSRVHLGPNTKVSIDELEAHPSDGPRVVALTQWSGETRHEVAPSKRYDSRYEVQTPSARGKAKGTAFQVFVTPDLFTRFNVDQGAVDVTGANVTVAVKAGQSTTVDAGETPSDPVFRISGEGRVTQIGMRWVIAGQTFETHERTVTVGNPQVGDWVSVEGRLLPDDTRLADRIILLRRAPENRFAITGKVNAIGAAGWTIAGQSIGVNDETDVEDNVEVGDRVSVEGLILEDGALLAERIQLLDEAPGRPFEFTGVVQDIAGETWTISGVAVTTDADTAIGDDIVVGDVVQVRGRILEDDTWLARSIERGEKEAREFEITGPVESMAPWVVAGISFETSEWTEIDAGIEMGDRVKVKGRILEDGTWLATEVEQMDVDDDDDDDDDEDDDDDVVYIKFVGTVNSIDPWVVSGIPLFVNDRTRIKGDVGVGDLVKVKARILPFGILWAKRIQRIDAERHLGCFTITTMIVGLGSDQVDLLNWPSINPNDYAIEGRIRVDSIVVIVICVDAEGTVEIVSVVVIYEPVVIIAPPPPPPPQPHPPRPPRRGGDDDDDDDDDD